MCSFNSYVYRYTHGFIISSRVFNLLTRTFNLLTAAFILAIRAFSLLTREFKLVTRGFELVTCGFELVTRISELVTLQLITSVLLFHYIKQHNIFKNAFSQNKVKQIIIAKEIFMVFTSILIFLLVSYSLSSIKLFSIKVIFICSLVVSFFYIWVLLTFTHAPYFFIRIETELPRMAYLSYLFYKHVLLFKISMLFFCQRLILIQSF